MKKPIAVGVVLEKNGRVIASEGHKGNPFANCTHVVVKVDFYAIFGYRDDVYKHEIERALHEAEKRFVEEYFSVRFGKGMYVTNNYDLFKSCRGDHCCIKVEFGNCWETSPTLYSLIPTPFRIHVGRVRKRRFKWA